MWNFAIQLAVSCSAYMMTSSNGNIFRVTDICAGNSPVAGVFPAQRPVTRSFDVFFDLHLNKRLSKQRWGWWFETPSWSLWCQCNDKLIYVFRVLGKNNCETAILWRCDHYWFCTYHWSLVAVTCTTIYIGSIPRYWIKKSNTSSSCGHNLHGALKLEIMDYVMAAIDILTACRPLIECSAVKTQSIFLKIPTKDTPYPDH